MKLNWTESSEECFIDKIWLNVVFCFAVKAALEQPMRHCRTVRSNDCVFDGVRLETRPHQELLRSR